MLIVCPSCATSYMIDQASVGPGGRTVRCARCKATWFAGGTEPAPGNARNNVIRMAPDVNAFVDDVIAEAEAQSGSGPKTQKQAASPRRESASASEGDGGGDDFGGDEDQESGAAGMPAPREPAKPPPPAKPPAMPRAEAFAAARPQATPERIDDAPSLVPPIEHEAFPDDQAAGDAEDGGSFAARRERLKTRRQRSRRSSRWTALLLVLVALNVAIVGARHEVVRYLPQTASLFAAIGLPVNLRQLRFENVRISKETEEGVAVLIVAGAIVSDAGKATEVPRLRFAARDTSGQEIYTWTMLPERSVLQPGEKLDFRSRLAAPPKDAQDVMVRFFTAKDAEAKAGK